MVPPPYTSFSFRSFFEYDGPSLMDGVDPEQNVHDNLSDVWASKDEVATVESLADGFINGNLAAREAFARAGVTLFMSPLRWIMSCCCGWARCSNASTREPSPMDKVSLLCFLLTLSI